MQKKFVYKKKNVSEDAKDSKAVLTYTPDDMDSKDIELKVKDIDLAKQLGLPTESFNDSVIVEFGAKEIQSKLLIKEDNIGETFSDDKGGDSHTEDNTDGKVE